VSLFVIITIGNLNDQGKPKETREGTFFMSVIERPSLQPSSIKTAASRPTAPPPRQRRTTFVPLLIAAVLVGGVGWGVYHFATRTTASSSATKILTRKAEYQSFDVKIPLTGELRAVKNVEIRSAVETNTTIVFIAPEGSKVNTGDLLVRLASDQIRDKLEEITLRVENDRAAAANAQSALDIQLKQNTTDIAAAQVLAEISKKEWDQFSDEKNGDAKIQLDTLTTAATNALADRDRKQEDLKHAKELFAQKYISNNDVLDAEIALRDAENKLQTANAQLVLWNTYARSTKEMTIKRKMDLAAADLQRVIANGKSKVAQCESDLNGKKATLRIDEDRKETLERQLAACEIRAPQPGMVVYQSSVNNNWNDSGLIQEGMSVYFNRPLIQLPDTSSMMAEVRLAEQLIDRVKPGQEVSITIDAIPGRQFHGKIATIATLPDGNARWSNSNTKEYITRIPLDENIDQTKLQIKPGMTAKCEIIVKRVEDAVTVPTQAVFTAAGKSHVYVGSASSWKKVPVTVGASSPTLTQIVEGVAAGDSVLLSRPSEDEDRGEKQSKNASASTSPAPPAAPSSK
jgi:multidrug efflux pump subunit AcrA (membrane-fusion protein)